MAKKKAPSKKGSPKKVGKKRATPKRTRAKPKTSIEGDLVKEPQAPLAQKEVEKVLSKVEGADVQSHADDEIDNHMDDEFDSDEDEGYF